MLNKFLKKHEKRIVGLDIMRSVAILSVVYGHGVISFPKANWEFYRSLNILKVNGVSIFFVLSGFLIGGILLKIINETNFNSKDLLNFWIRRWFRTVPNYLFVIAIVLIYKQLKFNSIGDFSYKYLFFIQNFWSKHPNFFPEGWSLTVEEWFYILFPVSCYLIHKTLKNKTKSILFSALLFLFIPLILRVIKFSYGIGIDNFDLEYRKIMLLRLDSLMYGIIGAYIYFKQPEFWIKYKTQFLVLGIFLLVLLFINPADWKNFYKPLYFNIESITIFCFLPALSLYKTTKVKALDCIFIFVSLISYSMYLLNLSPIQWNFLPLLKSTIGWRNVVISGVNFSNYIVFWLLTIFGSYFLYRFFENPVTKLRDKVKVY